MKKRWLTLLLLAGTIILVLAWIISDRVQRGVNNAEVLVFLIIGVWGFVFFLNNVVEDRKNKNEND